MDMADYDTLAVGIKNPYGYFAYTVNVDSMSISEKHDAIRLELTSNGWIITKKLDNLILKGLYLMAIEGFN